MALHLSFFKKFFCKIPPPPPLMRFIVGNNWINIISDRKAPKWGHWHSAKKKPKNFNSGLFIEENIYK